MRWAQLKLHLEDWIHIGEWSSKKVTTTTISHLMLLQHIVHRTILRGAEGGWIQNFSEKAASIEHDLRVHKPKMHRNDLEARKQDVP